MLLMLIIILPQRWAEALPPLQVQSRSRTPPRSWDCSPRCSLVMSCHRVVGIQILDKSLTFDAHRSVPSFQVTWRILWKRSTLSWTQGGLTSCVYWCLWMFMDVYPAKYCQGLIIRAETKHVFKIFVNQLLITHHSHVQVLWNHWVRKVKKENFFG